MTKIFDFISFIKQVKSSNIALNESASEYYNEITDFETLVHEIYDSYRYDIDRKKEAVSYLEDDVKKLIAEIRGLPVDAFMDFYSDSYDSDNIMLFYNNSDDFFEAVNDGTERRNVKGMSLLYNTGSWKSDDKYGAIVYTNSGFTKMYVCSFNDENFPTKNDEFMDYFLYIAIDMNGWDAYMSKFGFDYKLGFDENKRKIMAEYDYPESMIDLVYGMYLKYHDHNGWEPEIK